MNTDELNAMIDYWQGRAETAEAAITLAKFRLKSAVDRNDCPSALASTIKVVLDGLAQNNDGEIIYGSR